MSMHPVAELDRRQRRLEISASVISALLTCSLLHVIYYLVPFDDLTSGQSLLRL
ncbi:MAG TPA: hypothetical protein VHM29_08355 [Acidimicrobiia bacterium]|nr:hypothetical protein [Acidimicrobiia bacterium]